MRVSDSASKMYGYDKDTRFDTEGRTAHMASAGRNLERAARETLDALNPVNCIMDGAMIVQKRGLLFGIVFGPFLCMMMVGKEFLEIALLPFMLIKDLSDAAFHLVARIFSGQDGKILDDADVEGLGETPAPAPFDFDTPRYDYWQFGKNESAPSSTALALAIPKRSNQA